MIVIWATIVYDPSNESIRFQLPIFFREQNKLFVNIHASLASLRTKLISESVFVFLTKSLNIDTDHFSLESKRKKFLKIITN